MKTLSHFLLFSLVVLALSCSGDQPQNSSTDSTDPTSTASPAGQTPSIQASFDLDHPWTPEALENTPRETLRIMRNEYYARRGYIFKSEDLRTRFAEMGYPAERENVDTLLTELDKQNIQAILAAESRAVIESQPGEQSPLTVKDFEGIGVADPGFRFFLEKFLEAAFADDKETLEQMIHPGYQGGWNGLSHKQWDDEDVDITYKIERVEDDRWAYCDESIEVRPEEAVYFVSVLYQFNLEEDFEGRDSSMEGFFIKGSGEQYQLFCMFAAG